MKAVVVCQKQLMFEPFVDEIRRLPERENYQPEFELEEASCRSHRAGDNSYLLAALPVVQKIVRRKLLGSWSRDGADLVQKIALRLWAWRENNLSRDEKMSLEEWQAFAARAAYNETCSHFTREAVRKSEPLDLAAGVELNEKVLGNTSAEFQSLVNFIWQAVCRMTLRQRRALLFHSQELIVYLLRGGISEKMLAEALEIETREWSKTITQIPLADADIARLESVNSGKGLATSAGSIKKARHEARLRLKEAIKK